MRLASSVGSGFATTTIREVGPQRRTLESDIMRSLVLWPDEEEPESGSSSSECPWALEDEPVLEAVPEARGIDMTCWFDWVERGGDFLELALNGPRLIDACSGFLGEPCAWPAGYCFV